MENICILLTDFYNTFLELDLYDFSAFFQLIATFAIACIVIDSIIENNFSKFMEKVSRDSIFDIIVDTISSSVSENKETSIIDNDDSELDQYFKEKTPNNVIVLSCQCTFIFIYCIIILLVSPIMKKCETLYVPFILYSILVFVFICFFRFCHNRIINKKKIMLGMSKNRTKNSKEFRYYKISLKHLLFFLLITTIITLFLFFFIQNEQKFYSHAYFKLSIICIAIFTVLFPFLEQGRFYIKHIPYDYFSTKRGITKEGIEQMKKKRKQMIKQREKIRKKEIELDSLKEEYYALFSKDDKIEF